MIERRARQRFPLELRAEWRTGNGRNAPAQAGRTLNVSSSGLYLLGQQSRPKSGEGVQVAVWFPGASRGERVWLKGTGRVLRVEARPKTEFGFAVALDRRDWLRRGAAVA